MPLDEGDPEAAGPTLTANGGCQATTERTDARPPDEGSMPELPSPSHSVPREAVRDSSTMATR